MRGLPTGRARISGAASKGPPGATTLAALLAGDAVAYFVYEQRCMDCGPFFELLGAGVAVSCIPDDDLHPEYRAPEIRVLELRRA